MISPTRRFRTAGVALAAALLGAAAPPSDAPAAEPMLVVAFSGYDALMQDIDFVGGLAGHMQASQQAEMMIGMFTQNKGLEGLAKDKPIGVVVQSSGGMPEPLVCIPVTDADALLDVAKQFQITVEELGDGVLQIQSPGMPLFGKQTDGWLLLSIAPTAFDGAPADLGGLLGELTADYDLAAKVMMQNVPPAWRQQAIAIISQAANQSLSQEKDESDEAYEAHQQQVQQSLDEMKKAFDEFDELIVGLSVDQENAKVLLDVTTTALPGTDLAAEMAKNKNTTTDFAGFYEPDAAMMLTFAAPVTESNLSQLDQQLEVLRKQAYEGIDDEGKISDSGKAELKSAVDDALEALEATMRAGKIDGGAVLELAPGSTTFVMGGGVAEPQKLESALKKAIGVLQDEVDPTEDKPDVAWGAETYAGHSFHVITVPVTDEDEKDEAQKIFGNPDQFQMAVGIGEESVYFAFGTDWLAKVKSVIDASAANPGKSVPPVEMTFSVGQIVDVAEAFSDDEGKSILQMISSMIKNEANGRDHLRMVVQTVENGQRMRLELEEGVLRSIAMGAMAAQMQGAGR